MRSDTIGRLGAATAILGAALALAGPALAAGHGEGGHAGVGGHLGGGHAAAPHVGASAHAAGGAHFAGGSRFSAGAGYGTGGYGAHYAVGGHTAYGYPGGGYRHGYSTGGYWAGGYWRGGYWPRAYYGLGFAWFLPVLPLAYTTYWYDGIPYYYADDVYYTWNPDYSGYTATDPPPAAAPQVASPQSAPPEDAMPPAEGQIFMYPRNGQSEAQQSADKEACQQWAASQAGPQNTDDYRRAMVACVEGRGYSAE